MFVIFSLTNGGRCGFSEGFPEGKSEVLIEQGVDNSQDISINQGKYNLPETYILNYTMAKVY